MNGSNERDKSVDWLLRQSLGTPPLAAAPGPCLDAETLAAWVDGGLSGAALEGAQLHVVDCARCQALVGALARTTDVAPPEAVEATARPWWLMWMWPLAAAAAAVMLYVAVPRSPGVSSPVPEVQRQAEAKTEQPAALADRPQAPTAPPPPPPASQVQAPAATPTRPSVVATTTPAAANVQQAESSADLRQDGERRERDALSLAASGATAPPTASPAANDGAASARVVAPPAAPPAAPQAASKAAAASAAGPSAGAPAATPAAAARSLSLPRPEGRVSDVIAIASPDPLVRWRIVGGGLEHSADGGARWDAVSLGVPAALTAGAAPSVAVCWVVGRAGAIWRSEDGRVWRRVPFPEMTDLSSVRATDARAASVSTADGRTFNTTDGGTTWSR